MRACFLGQNVCALGFGVATLQIPPLVMDEPEKLVNPMGDQQAGCDDKMGLAAQHTPPFVQRLPV